MTIAKSESGRPAGGRARRNFLAGAAAAATGPGSRSPSTLPTECGAGPGRTLFATGNSRFDGKLVSVVPVGLNEDPALDGKRFFGAPYRRALSRAQEFDLIQQPFRLEAADVRACDLTDHRWSRRCTDFRLPRSWRPITPRRAEASIARSPTPIATRGSIISQRPTTASIRRSLRSTTGPENISAFSGRFHPEKGTHLAIEVAKRSGLRLKIAAIPQDEAYFREQVAPHIDGDRVQFLGAVEREARDELLANALALIHMTTRPERFGFDNGSKRWLAARPSWGSHGLPSGDRRRRVTGFLVR